jgi:hypothetical protein
MLHWAAGSLAIQWVSRETHCSSFAVHARRIWRDCCNQVITPTTRKAGSPVGGSSDMAMLHQ